MTDEQTPAAGPLNAESVALLRKGDLLRALKPCYGPDARIEQGDIVPFESTEHGLIGVAGDFWGPSAFTFLGRPDQDGWIKHEGRDNPAPGLWVDVRWNAIDDEGSDAEVEPGASESFPWNWSGPGRITHWRPHAPSPSAHPEPSSQGREDAVGPLACLEEIAEASWPGDDAVARIQAFAARELKAALASPAQDEPLGVDLGELKRLAEAATPGPWSASDWDDDFGKNLWTVEASEPEVVREGQSSIWPDGIRKIRVADTAEADRPTEDAAYIAAANPAVILKLIAEIERRGRK